MIILCLGAQLTGKLNFFLQARSSCRKYCYSIQVARKIYLTLRLLCGYDDRSCRSFIQETNIKILFPSKLLSYFIRFWALNEIFSLRINLGCLDKFCIFACSSWIHIIFSICISSGIAIVRVVFLTNLNIVSENFLTVYLLFTFLRQIVGPRW